MNKSLFNKFNPVSSKEWKQKIQADLKGADFNETLLWKSPEGIHVKPFYHRDELKENFSPIPSQPKRWDVGQFIFIDDATIANKLALDALQRGAEAIYFTAEQEFDIEKLFKNIPVENHTFYFDLKFLSPKSWKHPAFANANIHVLNDIINHHTQDGNWHNNLKEDFSHLEELLAETQTIFVDTTGYQNAGATITQQLAYALAHLNEYFNAFESKPAILKKVIFKVAVGSNYFFEIAKIRALRLLYTSLAKEYSFNADCHIIATPSKRNKTLYDYNVNMLRTTTECMSAVLGGADTICNLPYDALYHKSNEFGERISRNQLLILRHESYFDSVTNASDGSYYIESLTTQLAEKALEVFKDIEKGSGFLNQLKEGVIQKKIKESAAKEQQDFDKGEKVLLGTNKHPNKEDRMKNDLELYPFVKTKPRKTLIEPVIERRLAEKVEQERLDNE
ncbi:methylmalonyl-CoA mutase subunit beta [Planktosalinus lacus]|uniref:Methylmalonyl-CoA mutase n=1 Tax=Planktosalinus lacus TaxID=1526573 RepID=A0A8J2V830_9FLAO|nr:methylmalonyl-CoA mutase subunit beta [Planktosalinus lacus]GGD84370.1 methylmalonyl-CoA mutase [Planktosalinus lacus]